MIRCLIALPLVFLASSGPVTAQRLGLHARPPFPAFSGDVATRLVWSWYRDFLGREPDPGGLRTHVTLLRQGHPPEVVLAGIVGSDEYYQRAGRRSEAFVRALFLDLAGRRPTPAEVRHWRQRSRVVGRQGVAYEMILLFPRAAQPDRRPWW
jgi:hypothetical protein